MANFKINFEITTDEYAFNTPMYKVKVTTALVDPDQRVSYDGFLLLIERQVKSENPPVIADVFYGVIKPTDFKLIGKRAPNLGQNFFRVDAWNLIFYNEQTMNEAIALMKSQVNSVAEGVSVLMREDAQRSLTHISPSF
jgi:hypothetical protein